MDAMTVVMIIVVMILALRRHGGAHLVDRTTRRAQRAEKDAPLHP
jgi:hypothetical protein